MDGTQLGAAGFALAAGAGAFALLEAGAVKGAGPATLAGIGEGRMFWLQPAKARSVANSKRVSMCRNNKKIDNRFRNDPGFSRPRLTDTQDSYADTHIYLLQNSWAFVLGGPLAFANF